MSNNCNTCGGYVSAGGECRKCATPTNPPAKHPPRGYVLKHFLENPEPGALPRNTLFHVMPGSDPSVVVEYISEPEVTALLQEERARGREEMANALLKNLPEGVSLEILEAAIGEALAARSPGDAEKGEKNG